MLNYHGPRVVLQAQHEEKEGTGALPASGFNGIMFGIPGRAVRLPLTLERTMKMENNQKA